MAPNFWRNPASGRMSADSPYNGDGRTMRNRIVIIWFSFVAVHVVAQPHAALEFSLEREQGSASTGYRRESVLPAIGRTEWRKSTLALRPSCSCDPGRTWRTLLRKSIILTPASSRFETTDFHRMKESCTRFTEVSCNGPGTSIRYGSEAETRPTSAST